MTLIIEVENKLIFLNRFHSFDKYNMKTDMGYWLSEKHQGKLKLLDWQTGLNNRNRQWNYYKGR